MTTAPPRRVAIKIPELGTGQEAVRISAWLVDVGQAVVAGDRIVEVLTPGITFDIEAERTGDLIEIVKGIDSIVLPGEVIGWVDVTSVPDED